MRTAFTRAIRNLAATSCLVTLGALTACGGGSGASSNSPAPPPSSGIQMTGTVMGGVVPIAGSAVSAWIANPTPSAAATQIGQGTTNNNGQFTFSFTSVPANGQVVYLLAQGGDAGSGSNTAISLMTIAGAYCAAGQSGCAFPASVTLNELTTLVSLYSLAAFTQVSSGGVNVSGVSPGLGNAALSFASLVDAATGTATFQNPGACTGTGEPVNCNALRKLDTLSNALAACVNSAGSGSTACQGLFQQTGNTSDTLSAAFAIVTQSPVRDDGAGVFNLVQSAASVYAPSLASAPTDWTLAVSYTGGGLFQPAGIAVDAQGNLWVADYQQPAGAVSEFAPDGVPLSGSIGFTGGGLQGDFGLAVDASGNVWVANWNGGNGTSVTELATDGTPLSGANGFTGGGLLGPIAFALAPDGRVWVANSGNASITELNAAGQVSGPFTGGGLGYPISIALDAAGNIWVADQGSSAVSEFNASGTPVSANGYRSGGINSPAGLALDIAGNVWVSNFLSDSLTELVGGNTPVSSCPPSPSSADTGCPRSPAGGFIGGGLAGADNLAIDAEGRVFVTNFHSESVSEFSSTGQALSPASGYTNPALVLPSGIAIDASGNVWVADFGAGSLTKFIGLAAPVKTPLIGLPAKP